MQDTDPAMGKKQRVTSGRSTSSSLCVGCGGQILDQYILRVAPDLEWHASCLKCAECSCFLDETCTCFVREGKTYCKRDYVRLFGTKCGKCSMGFSKNDFVMRAKNKIFHIDCFRCVACSRQLIPGDEFALRDDGLFCRADSDIVDRSSNNNLSDVEIDTKPILNNNNNEKSASSQGSPNSTDSRTTSSGGRKKDGHKTTRVRTVLNEKQLHTLRTCYNANPRPDALMKEQLVEMTNLSPRVIRVWFQNKRCKDKKRNIQLKQMQQQQQEKWEMNNNGGEMLDPITDHRVLQQGVPMIASSPVRHEPPPNMQPAPVEVQSYQAPWKALSEFAAMGGDMSGEQPPFQQLMNSFEHGPDMGMGHPPPPPRGPSPLGPPHGSMMGYMNMDDLPPPTSVSSDNTLPGTPSELSSPLSQ